MVCQKPPGAQAECPAQVTPVSPRPHQTKHQRHWHTVDPRKIYLTDAPNA